MASLPLKPTAARLGATVGWFTTRGTGHPSTSRPAERSRVGVRVRLRSWRVRWRGSPTSPARRLAFSRLAIAPSIDPALSATHALRIAPPKFAVGGGDCAALLFTCIVVMSLNFPWGWAVVSGPFCWLTDPGANVGVHGLRNCCWHARGRYAVWRGGRFRSSVGSRSSQACRSSRRIRVLRPDFFARRSPRLIAA